MTPDIIKTAYERIKNYIHHTPILSSQIINQKIGHDIFFKYEGFQKIGAFKIRGALNALLHLKEQGILPQKLVTASSGNHAQAIAYAGRLLDIKVKVFFPPNPSMAKYQATIGYGAEVYIASSRKEAEELAKEEAQNGAYFLPPFDNDDIIAGQGTSCYEALNDLKNVDAIFAACGGGGWLSGTYLAKELLCPSAQVIGCEPALGNDATRSYYAGHIIALDNAPDTIADGARTLSVVPRTFAYLQKCNDFLEATEEEILTAVQYLETYLKVTIEPTSAVSMVGLQKWLDKTKPQTTQKLLVMISGGNVDTETKRKIWEKCFI